MPFILTGATLAVVALTFMLFGSGSLVWLGTALAVFFVVYYSPYYALYFAQLVLFIIVPLSPGGSGRVEVAFTMLMSSYVPGSALLGGAII